MRTATLLVALLAGVCGLALGVASTLLLNKPGSQPQPGKLLPNTDPQLGKRQLVEAVLERLDVPRRYNDSITSKSIQTSGPQADAKTAKWMRELWIQELGWEQAKASFIRYYDARFTEADLKELLGILDQPALKKLLVTEAEALDASSQERADRFSKFWLRYNNLEFQPPP